MTNDTPDVDDSIDSEPFEMELEDAEYQPEMRIIANPQESSGILTRAAGRSHPMYSQQSMSILMK